MASSTSRCRTWAQVGGRFVNRPYGGRGSGRLIAAPTGDGGCAKTPSVSGGRYTPLTPPPCGARKTLRTFVCLRFSTAAEIPASLLNALPHLPFPGLFHDGPPTARLRRFRSRFFCHRQRVTGILPLAARSRNSPGGGGKRTDCLAGDISQWLAMTRGTGRDPSVTGASAGDTSPCRGGKAHLS